MAKAFKLKIGERVIIKTTGREGRVVGQYRSSQAIHYDVSYGDSDGVAHSRYFAPEELEAVAPDPVADAL